MTIEVKQLVIKSSVNDTEAREKPNAQGHVDLDAFKKELLAECKQVVIESLNNARER